MGGLDAQLPFLLWTVQAADVVLAARSVEAFEYKAVQGFGAAADAAALTTEWSEVPAVSSSAGMTARASTELASRPGMNTLFVRSVSRAGGRSAHVRHAWASQAQPPVLYFAATPPTVSGWRMARFSLVLVLESAQVAVLRLGGAGSAVVVEVALDDEAWADSSVACMPSSDSEAAGCAVVAHGLLPGSHQLRARALYATMPGAAYTATLSHSWTLSECGDYEYSELSSDGALTCHDCPVGGQCLGMYIAALWFWWRQR